MRMMEYMKNVVTDLELLHLAESGEWQPVQVIENGGIITVPILGDDSPLGGGGHEFVDKEGPMSYGDTHAGILDGAGNLAGIGWGERVTGKMFNCFCGVQCYRLLDFLPLKNAKLEKLCMKWELHKNLH